jgi:hypothetical protein
VYHEGRHAYQQTLATIGTDADQDYLILANLTGLPAASTIIDSTATRSVCNTTTASIVQQSYLGDGTADNPTLVIWALEKDAYDFEQNRAIQQ